MANIIHRSMFQVKIAKQKKTTFTKNASRCVNKCPSTSFKFKEYKYSNKGTQKKKEL